MEANKVAFLLLHSLLVLDFLYIEHALASFFFFFFFFFGQIQQFTLIILQSNQQIVKYVSIFLVNETN